MKKSFLFFIGLIMVSCSDPIFKIEISSSVEMNLDILGWTPGMKIVNILDYDDKTDEEIQNTDSTNSAYVIFYGNVIEYDSASLVNAALVRIKGSDNPECHAITDENGSFKVSVPIIPDKNDETILFAVEVQKKGAVTFPISDFCKDPEVWKLFDCSDHPQEHTVACAISNHCGWDIVGKGIECNLPIKMKK